MKKTFFIFFLFLIISLSPLLALADWRSDLGGLDTTAGEGAGLNKVDVGVFVGRIIQGVLSLLGIVILIYMVYGGYLWLISGGNEQTVRKAKDILVNAVIGLIIVLAAYAITTFIISELTAAISG